MDTPVLVDRQKLTLTSLMQTQDVILSTVPIPMTCHISCVGGITGYAHKVNRMQMFPQHGLHAR